MRVWHGLMTHPHFFYKLYFSINCFIFQLKLKNLFEIFGEFNYSLYFCESN